VDIYPFFSWGLLNLSSMMSSLVFDSFRHLAFSLDLLSLDRSTSFVRLSARSRKEPFCSFGAAHLSPNRNGLFSDAHPPSNRGLCLRMVARALTHDLDLVGVPVRFHQSNIVRPFSKLSYPPFSAHSYPRTLSVCFSSAILFFFFASKLHAC